MLQAFKRGQASVILHGRFKNAGTGQGITGLSGSSPGLIIATLADTEAAPTVYTQVGGTIQSITTLGTYAAPPANNCRLREVDATNFPGLYQFQFADARLAVTGAKSFLFGWTGAASLQTDASLVTLQDIDPYDPLSVIGKQMTAGLAADGTLPNVSQILQAIWLKLTERSVSGTTETVKGFDGVTTAMTFTLNDPTNPTSITRAT